MKTVVAFSGGLDSTLIMWKLLSETDEEITAVYIDGQNIEDDIYTSKQPEQFTLAQKIVDELQKIRPFTFLKHTLTPEEISEEIHHKTLLFIQHIAPFINDGTYDKLVQGASYDAQHQKLVPHLEYIPGYYAAKRLFDKLCTRGEYSIPLVTDTWYTKYNRAYAFRDLPLNFRKLINTCNFMVYSEESSSYVRCGECSRCLGDMKIRQFMREGKTPAEILDWIEEKSYEYGDGVVMTPIIKWIYLEMGSPKARLTKEELQQSAGTHFHFNRVRKFNNTEGSIWKGLFAPE